ncbi:calcium/sodium antiporter [Methylotuvimicrobium alcaliphilum]|uniref:Inner membrane protein yrbG n=1 Tax=Methylotuvimicrobium alcaliphilum (strain DSM 19304 / NCIMB 14124 / VKM B-2133 / 20Z) TaxID=1091494 RepID=G4T0Q8_META2|nr:calcium/sodium antiporter [Methylotuvimicrobium alcaliphilum]CCE22338.1 Inner membrane protein yrbG [Methylotuvimicrobium alcaliphilum 20Z]
MWCDSIVLIASLALMVYSADTFVDGAAAIAQNWGVSTLLIGLTVVGFGTSIPEVLVSSLASWQGNAGLAVGNALGSNIANIGLILGCCALIMPLTFRPKLLSRELPLLLITSLLCFGLAFDGLSLSDGIILLVGLVCFITWLVRNGLDQSKNGGFDDTSAMPLQKRSMILVWFFTIIGLLGLLISARLLVWASVNIANELGVSDLVIGLTLVAMGTSLPELAASAASVLKRQTDMAVGNVIGSNMYNLLAVYSLPGLIAPGPVNESVLSRDFPVMLALTLALFVFGFGFFKSGRINRWEGLFLLSSYGAYQWLVFKSTITG